MGKIGYKTGAEEQRKPKLEIGFTSVSVGIDVNKATNNFRFTDDQKRPLKSVPEEAIMGVEQLINVLLYDGLIGLIYLNLATDSNSEIELKINIADFD